MLPYRNAIVISFWKVILYLPSLRIVLDNSVKKCSVKIFTKKRASLSFSVRSKVKHKVNFNCGLVNEN